MAIEIQKPVLATFLESLIVFHNERYSTTLKIEDFHSYHFCDVWGGTNEEAIVKVNAYFESNHFLNLPKIPGSFEVRHTRLVKPNLNALHALKSTGLYEFHVVTSRQTLLEPVTRSWLEKHFPDIFETVHHGNAYGDGVKREKGEMCSAIGAVALIDDNWKYIKQVTDLGMVGVMFNLDNKYNWSRPTSVPSNCVVAHSWDAIKEAISNLKPM